MTMPDYIQQHDKDMAARLVAECLRCGYVVSVSVSDGEEWVLKRSTDQDAILSAMGSTEIDQLRVSAIDATGTMLVGSFDMYWGNGPGETIADHSANDECESLYNHAFEPFN